jgi:4,5-DOPA dioxygenase extradiol
VYQFLSNLAQDDGAIVPKDKVKSVLLISAHWMESVPQVNTANVPEQVYDFYGFEPECYQFKYPARGDSKLSKRVIELLGNSNDVILSQVQGNSKHGLDHGAWSPLSIVFPNADIPIVQVSLLSSLNPETHVRMGKALAPLRDEGVLIIGSGGSVHNLGKLDWSSPQGNNPAVWAKEFDEYLEKVLKSGEILMSLCLKISKKWFITNVQSWRIPQLNILRQYS